jgi:hypothetical protein
MMPTLAVLRDDDLSGMVRGVVTRPRAVAGFEESGRLSICLFFDKQGVCVGHLIHWFV